MMGDARDRGGAQGTPGQGTPGQGTPGQQGNVGQGPGPQQADQPEGAPGVGEAEAGGSFSPRGGEKVFVTGEDEPRPRGGDRTFEEDTGLRSERGGYRTTVSERGDDVED